MTITNGYLTLEELQNHLQSSGMPTTYSPMDLANMETAIMAMSRVIDQYLGGSNFYGSSETRYFTPLFGDLVEIDDLISVTTLKTDNDGDGTHETTWTSSDYWLEPRNARSNSDAAQNEPFRQIRANPNGNYVFPSHIPYGVEVNGSWGYTDSVPEYVKQVMLLMANRIFRRKDAIFGIAGSPQLGVQVVRAKIQQDSDITFLLKMLNTRGL